MSAQVHAATAAPLAAPLLASLRPGADAAADASATALYEGALQLTRTGQYDAAGHAYEQLLGSFPGHAKGWISYGQMQKKRLRDAGGDTAYEAAGTVLRRGAAAVEAADCSRAAAGVVQALGLLDLQYGRPQQAVQQLQRAVQLDERLAPVLQWRAVKEAQQAQQAQQ